MLPEFKNKLKSIERAELLISELENPSEIDLLVLPEMALIGYRFDNREDIAPYTEVVPSDIEALCNQIESDAEE